VQRPAGTGLTLPSLGFHPLIATKKIEQGIQSSKEVAIPELHPLNIQILRWSINLARERSPGKPKEKRN